MTDTEQQKSTEWMGKNSKLSLEELAAFLAGPMVARVATIDEEGLPYITPVWQEWDGEAMWIIPRERSAWVNHIKLHPKVAISVAEDSGTYKRVLMRGTAEIISGPEPLSGLCLEIANRMATRFLGEHGPDYLVPSIPNPRYLIKFVPDSMITWDGVGWAKKYTE